jgi:uncharacterized RDD family membrane protein YckC
LVVAVYLIATFIYSFITGTDFLTNTEKVSEMNPLLDRVITSICFAFFMFLIEFGTKGRSLGKLITGTIVVNENGGLPITQDFLKRNFSRIVPFDALSFLGSRGWHDSWSDTRVVKRKSYLEALERENSIDDIGQIAS